MITKAVVLAAGRGSRMRRDDRSAVLTPEQQAAADVGAKAMMPVGYPFLDYVLSSLADAGLRDVCIVVARGETAIRARYAGGVRASRLNVSFVEQKDARGTADAVACAREFAGNDPFIVLNGDNLYDVATIRRLMVARPPALAGYDRNALIERGNIPAERIAAFAFLRVSPAGMLEDIVEKPDAATAAALGKDAPLSMNLWLLGPEIFDACVAVAPSPRGELELAGAVRFAMEHGATFQVVPADEGVLDLSSRADVAAVATRLRDVTVGL